MDHFMLIMLISLGSLYLNCLKNMILISKQATASFYILLLILKEMDISNS